MPITQEEREYLIQSSDKVFITDIELSVALTIIKQTNDFHEALTTLSSMLPPAYDYIALASSHGAITPDHILLMSNSDASRVLRLNKELSKSNEILKEDNNRKTSALKECEEAQAARLKAEELAKTQAEKIQRLEKLLEEEYARSKQKDDELIECLEKSSFTYNCENKFSGEESDAQRDGI